MRSKLIAVFVTATLLLCSLAHAQVETHLTRKKALLGVTNPVVQGNRILVGEDSNVAVSDVMLLDVKTDYKFSRIKAKKDGSRIEPEKVGESSYLFAGAGQYVVEVTAFDPDKGIDDKEVSFTIGGKPTPPGPPPEPEPEPTPNVVPNDYGVGLLTYQETPADLANAAKFAKLYRDAAGKLYGQGGLASVEKVLSDISSTIAGRQCSDHAKCEQWGAWKTKLDAAIKAEQNRRSVFTRQDWFAALSEVATALEAKK